jgi:hypothetical protein
MESPALRIGALVLTMALAILLVWSFVAGVGGFETWCVLLVAVVAGSVYGLRGRLPTWLLDVCGDLHAVDGDPASAWRVYASLFLCAVAIVAVGVALYFVL